MPSTHHAVRAEDGERGVGSLARLHTVVKTLLAAIAGANTDAPSGPSSLPAMLSCEQKQGLGEHKSLHGMQTEFERVARTLVSPLVTAT